MALTSAAFLAAGVCFGRQKIKALVLLVLGRGTGIRSRENGRRTTVWRFFDN